MIDVSGSFKLRIVKYIFFNAQLSLKIILLHNSYKISGTFITAYMMTNNDITIEHRYFLYVTNCSK